nr:MAG TPA: hypothetical protein [Caudoviricetes sp.]
MTAKEYLSQAYRLDQRINSNLAEIERLRQMAVSISSPVLGEKVKMTRSQDPPYVRCVHRIMELDEKINSEIDLVVSLKEQIRDVIESVPNADEQMVLRYRYIHNYTWERIGEEMNADPRTVRRWHGKALSNTKIPANPILI